MSRQMRTHSNRLKLRNGSDRCTCERYKTRSIAHGNKVLGENWIRSRVGNGIPTKKQRGGQRRLQSPSSLRHPHRHQLYGLIPRIVLRKPKLHRLRNRMRKRIADEDSGGVDEAAGEEEVKAATRPRRAMSPPSLRKRRESDGLYNIPYLYRACVTTTSVRLCLLLFNFGSPGL